MPDAERILALRLARSGLAERSARTLAEAAACPASDFSRDAALLALNARAEGVTREAYDAAVDSGELVVAHIVRGAIHALDPADFGLYGRALIATDDAELGQQLGRQVRKLGFPPRAALEEVAEATRDALVEPLDKNALHQALRERVKPEYMPWCRGCGSHHVAPMLWRYATVAAGARLDSRRRYTLAEPGEADPAEAVRRFLHFYGPNSVAGFAEWAGIAKPHAQRLWEAAEVDQPDCDSPPQARGIRLLPPGDPYLQKPNRALLAPDDALRKRLFRPVGSPGAVLQDGRLAGLWTAKAKGRQLEIAVEPLQKLRKAELEAEAERIAALRGAALVMR